MAAAPEGPVTDTATPIVTPEAVVLDFETAGVGSRSVAKLLDVLVQVTAIFAVVLIVTVGFAAAGSEEAATVITLVASFLVLIGYPVLIEWLWNGKSLGKAAMGVRAVTREGAPIRFRHAALRGIIGLVEVYAFGFIAVLTAALSRHDQRVGDLAAGTIVIRERTASDHAVSLSFFVPPGYETYAESLDTSSLDAQQYQLIRSFLTRVLQLSPEARIAMAFRLANPIAVELDHEPPPGVGPELFLVCVAAAYQKRHGGAPASPWAPASGGWAQQGGWSAPTGWGPPTAAGYGWGTAGQPPYATQAPSPGPAPYPGQPPYPGPAPSAGQGPVGTGPPGPGPTAPPPGWTVVSPASPAGATAPPPTPGAPPAVGEGGPSFAPGGESAGGGFDPPA